MMTTGSERAASWSLITVTYNSAETLRRNWTGSDLPEGSEWIVVDNGSTDDSAGVAESLGARVIRSSENRGFSAANNLGYSHAGGDFIGYINPDVRVDAAGLARLAEVAAASGGLVAPQLLNPDGSEQPNGRGYPLLTAKIRNRLRGGDPHYLLRSEDGSPRAVCWAMGAAILGSRGAVDRIGGWDPTFFLYYEDKDICLRSWRADAPVLLVPDARWVHEWARETTGFRWAPWRREIASMARFYSRYPEFLTTRARSRRAHPDIDAAVFGARV
jgi:GT2 family glycosyltransferase